MNELNTKIDQNRKFKLTSKENINVEKQSKFMKKDVENVNSQSDMLKYLQKSISSLNTESSTTNNSIIENNKIGISSNNIHNSNNLNKNDKTLESSLNHNQLNLQNQNSKQYNNLINNNQEEIKNFSNNKNEYTNNKEMNIRIRSSSKKKSSVKEEISNIKFNNASLIDSNPMSPISRNKMSENIDLKPRINMGRTSIGFFNSDSKNKGMATTADSFQKQSRVQNSFQGTTNNFNTTNGFNKEIKIRSSYDKNNIKRDMKRFKTQEEPVIERNFKSETLKKLTGCRDLLKVKFFSIRDQIEDDVDFSNIGNNLSNLENLEINECKLTSLKNLGNDLNCLNSISIYKCKLTNLQGLSSLTNLKKLSASFNHITSTDGLFQHKSIEEIQLDGNLIDQMKSVEGIITCNKLIAISFLENPINYYHEQDLQDLVTKKIQNIQFLNYQPIEEQEFTNMSNRDFNYNCKIDNQEDLKEDYCIYDLFGDTLFQNVQLNLLEENNNIYKNIKSNLNSNKIQSEESDQEILLSLLRKDYEAKSDIIDVNLNSKNNNALDIRLRNFANFEDLEDMDNFDQEEKQAKLDEQQLNMAQGGRMKNLKNIKRTVDVQQADVKLLNMVKNQYK